MNKALVTLVSLLLTSTVFAGDNTPAEQKKADATTESSANATTAPATTEEAAPADSNATDANKSGDKK